MKADNPPTILNKLLNIITPVYSDESKGALLLFFNLYMLLFTAYILKPVREILILTQGGAELRSYSVAIQALLLVFLIPLYGYISRRTDTQKLMQKVTLFFSFVLLLFAFLASQKINISVPYFVWLGAYGVLIVSQFWAYASDLYNKEAGERIFVIVALGASIGAWSGSIATGWLVSKFDAYQLIILAATTLTLSALPSLVIERYIPKKSRAIKDSDVESNNEKQSFIGGFGLVFNNKLLVYIAIFVMLLNCLNSLGEYLVSALVEMKFEQAVAQGSDITKEVFVGEFYSLFYFVVNLCGVLLQFFMVSRLIKWLGLHGAFMLAPVVVMIGYGVLLFIPIISVFRMVKIADNSLDYSLQNTTRQMLYLPMTRREKYEGRAIIETLFVRFGDMFQALLIFIAINIFYWRPPDFAPLTFFLAVVVAGLALIIVLNNSKLYPEKTEKEAV